ncbi:hypothetical protein IFM89_030617 [Coptis chinensis]|uniref:Uncharacterized protein n=1 Tax=Coptis chinensis TaxID=261450 RepID=A0A835HNL8_9MAGN|nr:hypothetical protein IFM89_030617 [Coptis chinensis]
MRRLKMELKQTMDMYNTTCKEAVSARHKAVEFHQWKINEARKFEDAKLFEEAKTCNCQDAKGEGCR